MSEIKLKPQTFALFWNPEEGYSLLTAQSDPVPEEAVALCAVFLKISRDEEFRKQIVDDFINGRLPVKKDN